MISSPYRQGDAPRWCPDGRRCCKKTYVRESLVGASHQPVPETAGAGSPPFGPLGMNRAARRGRARDQRHETVREAGITLFFSPIFPDTHVLWHPKPRRFRTGPTGELSTKTRNSGPISTGFHRRFMLNQEYGSSAGGPQIFRSPGPSVHTSPIEKRACANRRGLSCPTLPRSHAHTHGTIRARLASLLGARSRSRVLKGPSRRSRCS